MTDEVMAISLDQWANTKPVPMELTEEEITEIHAMMDKVGERLKELGTSFTFSFVTKTEGTGNGQLQSRVHVTPTAMPPEIWVGMLTATGGLDAVIDSMEALIDASNERVENCTKLSLIVPSKSIIVP